METVSQIPNHPRNIITLSIYHIS